ncbi:protein translocase subunit SecD [Fodinibius sp.]|uniref:protein translocase subunit SecD n=1 Tax=Fodinibius sp. TaxID=1872440 RepID=UPI002ACE88B0|nr:protein translocase subunit SecD [Fodinibius sp.]
MMRNARIVSVVIVLIGILLGAFVVLSEKEDSRFSGFAFKYGLDLSGGTQLIYNADTSEVAPEEVEDSMSALRDVIERRVNLFGVSEPRVQVEKGGLAGGENRLIVELPGVTDINEAIAMIGETPVLEFRLRKDESELEIDQSQLEGLNINEGTSEGETTEGESSEGSQNGTTAELELSPEDLYEKTELTGRYVKSASVQFDQTTGEPIVNIRFNSEGRDLFAEITRDNVGEVLAIFLDGEVISTPVIREEIPTGEAVISGQFTPEEARKLARDLSFGALPVPIELVSTNSVGPILGQQVLDDGVSAGIIGFALILGFMIVWYRLPGIVAAVALVFYTLVMLSLFKLIPVTLTASGIAAFILSVGMAVDANVIIFERIKEELQSGKGSLGAIQDGFDRAWPAVRDANLSSLISAVVLFYFGSSIVQGFALVFGIGVLVSMISALVVTKTFLYAVSSEKHSESKRKMFASGFSK